MNTKQKARSQEPATKVAHLQEETEFTDVPSTYYNSDVGTEHRHHKSSRRSRMVALLVGLGTLALAVLGVYLFIDKNEYSLRRANKGQNANFQGQVTYASMALHDVPEDCWMEIHGKVYDLTEYAPDHPGGPEYVTDYCGMQATRFFDMEHSKSLLSLIKHYNLGEAVTTLEGDSVMETAATESSSINAPRNPTSVDPSDNSKDSGDEEEYMTGTTQQAPVLSAGRTPATSTAPDNSATAAPPVTAANPEGCPVQYYSTATVAQHSSRYDCWYILYGNVWDFTSYVNVHPGGARRVFQYCGTDATVPYSQEKKHDQSLLAKKTPNLLIGKWGSKTEVRYESC